MTILLNLALLTGGVSKAVLDGDAMKDSDQCRTTKVMQSLATLPKGFVVASVDFGPFIVAQTRHDVLGAPYHRIDSAIVESFQIFRDTPDVAERKLQALEADYLIECVAVAKAGQPVRVDPGAKPGSLIRRLADGESVSFLTELKGATPEPMVRVWRVKRADER